MSLTGWLRDNLVCPRDRSPFTGHGRTLCCANGHEYPVVDGIPVLLIDDVDQTFGAASKSLARAVHDEADPRAPELHLESIEISDEEKQGVIELAARRPSIDPVVAYLVAATNGLMYRHLIGRLDSYPIPEIGLPPGEGRTLLDVGCSWGRLVDCGREARVCGHRPRSIAGAVMAARRVARQLNVNATFVVGDARYLPFRDASLDGVYSYSVVQHFSRADADRAIAEMGRVLTEGGFTRVQMPTRWGIRCLYQQARRGFSDGDGFEVRYWRIGDLRRMFGGSVGPSRIEVDGYFGIGLQQADARMMTRRAPARAWCVSRMTALSRLVPPLIGIADSVFVQATKQG